MDQALPPLFVRAGQRSYVDLLRGRREKPGDEATPRVCVAISLCVLCVCVCVVYVPDIM